MATLRHSIVNLILLAALLGGCAQATAVPASPTPPPASATPAPPTVTPSPLPPTLTPTSTLTPTVTPTPLPQAVGPDVFPANINPLTGLPVKDPELLKLPPALVSISNSPVGARPQAGLSFSPVVHEFFLGAGKTRYLTVFYGDFPEQRDEHNQALAEDKVAIGPIRSGRLPYETLRKLYNGFVVMAFASKWVMPNLRFYNNIISPDLEDINATTVSVAKLKGIAKERLAELGSPAISGHRFDPQPPAGGVPAESLWMPFAYYDQIFWRYNADDGGYHRFQDREDAENFDEIVDRLTGQPLAIENVIVMFCDYVEYRPLLVDINMMYYNRYPALAFRDGKMYKIYWSTGNEDYEKRTGKLRPIRFRDAQGNPFPLKPGQTWIEMVTRESSYFETVEEGKFFDLANKPKPGSAHWAVLFVAPVPLSSGDE